jgi:hypothetical protein
VAVIIQDNIEEARAATDAPVMMANPPATKAPAAKGAATTSPKVLMPFSTVPNASSIFWSFAFSPLKHAIAAALASGVVAVLASPQLLLNSQSKNPAWVTCGIAKVKRVKNTKAKRKILFFITLEKEIFIFKMINFY